MIKTETYLSVGNFTKADIASKCFNDILVFDDKELEKKFKSINKSLSEFSEDLRKRMNK